MKAKWLQILTNMLSHVDIEPYFEYHLYMGCGELRKKGGVARSCGLQPDRVGSLTAVP